VIILGTIKHQKLSYALKRKRRFAMAIVTTEQILKIVSGYTILLILPESKLIGMNRKMNMSVNKLITIGSFSSANASSMTIVDMEFMNMQLAMILQNRHPRMIHRYESGSFSLVACY